MPNYSITLESKEVVTGMRVIKVEADTEEEAREEAFDQAPFESFVRTYISDPEYTITDCKLIEPVVAKVTGPGLRVRKYCRMFGTDTEAGLDSILGKAHALNINDVTRLHSHNSLALNNRTPLDKQDLQDMLDGRLLPQRPMTQLRNDERESITLCIGLMTKMDIDCLI